MLRGVVKAIRAPKEVNDWAAVRPMIHCVSGAADPKPKTPKPPNPLNPKHMAELPGTSRPTSKTLKFML